MMPRLLLSLLFVSCVSVSAARAQQPAGTPAAQQQAPAPVERQNPSEDPAVSKPSAENTLKANVRLVVLDMVVVDGEGHAVTDLKRDEFHIVEDGQPQTVRYFEPAGRSLPAAGVDVESTADLDRLAPNAPVNLVLLDEFNTRFEDMAFARYSLKKWLEKQPAHLTTPTMLLAVDLQHFTVVRDYTQNKDELLQSLEKHLVSYPWQAHEQAWTRERYATALLSLSRVADATRAHPGHKNMIWVGRGFPTLNRRRVSLDAESHVNSHFQQAVNALRNARVTLYTIDPAGVMTNPGNYGNGAAQYAPFGGDPDFAEIARATGGYSFFGRNDVDQQIGTSLRDGASFYTVAYRPADNSYDTHHFREIHVKVDRPGYTVITRTGYYQERHAAHIEEDGSMGRRLVAELSGAINSNMVYDGVPLTLRNAGGGKYVVHVNGPGLLWTPASDTEPRKAKVVMLFATFDKSGKMLMHEEHDITVGAPPSVPASGSLERAMDIPCTLADNPKAVRARFVVRVDGTGNMGTADLPLTPGSVAGNAGATAKP